MVTKMKFGTFKSSALEMEDLALSYYAETLQLGGQQLLNRCPVAKKNRYVPMCVSAMPHV